MAELPFMKFYTGDWIRDTRFLPGDAKGAWIDTICALWQSKPPGLLSRSVCEWARLWGVPETEANVLIEQLDSVAELVRTDSEVIIACRRIVKEELEKERERNKKRSQRGQDPSWEYAVFVSQTIPRLCPGGVPGLSPPCPPGCPPIVPATPDTRDQRPNEERVSAREALAESSTWPETIVQAYPRREDVCGAMQTVARLIDQGVEPEGILSGTRAIAAAIRESGASPTNKFIVSAETFFRKRRFEDDPDVWRKRLQRPVNGSRGKEDDDVLEELGELDDLAAAGGEEEKN